MPENVPVAKLRKAIVAVLRAKKSVSGFYLQVPSEQALRDQIRSHLELEKHQRIMDKDLKEAIELAIEAGQVMRTSSDGFAYVPPQA